MLPWKEFAPEGETTATWTLPVPPSTSAPNVNRTQAFEFGFQDVATPFALPRPGSKLLGLSGRGEWIRTTDLLVPNQAL
jgi:hypothetical protein